MAFSVMKTRKRTKPFSPSLEGKQNVALAREPDTLLGVWANPCTVHTVGGD
jgi:hypothetical protein